MFSCSACLRRAIYTLSSDLSPYPSAFIPQTGSQSLSKSSRPRPRSNGRLPKPIGPAGLGPPAQTRKHSTIQSLRKGHHQKVLREALRSNKPTLPNRVRGGKTATKVSIRDAHARSANREALDRTLSRNASESQTEPEFSLQKRQSKEEWRVQNYLRDPLKLAGAVLEKLRANDSVGALELVRASEKIPAGVGPDGQERLVALDNVVSWNHLMDWHMHEGDTRGALRVYNELKKRGHKPDAHTYTIILRGFAHPNNIKKPNAVRDAVSVYNSIFATNSRVTPNTIHTNAIVNVCAKGGDMDALWSVTGRLPEKGPGAPDKWTFSTVLNALRVDAVAQAARVARIDSGSGAEDDGAAVEKIFEQAVRDGRKLWEDVIKKWRAGDIMIDEPLVCAMGRLLMISLKSKNWVDVGNLVAQTMDVTNMIQSAEAGQSLSDSSKEDSKDGAELSEQELSESRRTALTVSNEFTPILPLRHSAQQSSSNMVANTNTSVYAIPANNALSLLIETSTLLKNPAAGKQYFDLLTTPTGPFRILPDAQNLTAYLRLLRISRSSKVALDVLRGNYPEHVEETFFKRGTFIIAMSTCIRDKNNPNVFDYASSILDLMQEKGSYASLEPKALSRYIELAAATTPGIDRAFSSVPFVPDLRKNNAMRMLARLRPDVVNIRQLVKMKIDEVDFDKLPTPVRRKKEKYRPPGVPGTGLEDLADVLKGMVGVIDRILGVAARRKVEFSGGMQESEWEEYLRELEYQKRKLAAFLTKMIGSSPSWFKREAAPTAEAAEEAEEGEEEISDEEAQKSVPGKRKIYRAMKEGVDEYQKLPRLMTKRSVRLEKEQKRVAKIRSQFPPSMLKPWPAPLDGKPSMQERVMARERDRKRERTKGSATVQKGWGGGFDRMVQREGDGKSGDFIEI